MVSAVGGICSQHTFSSYQGAQRLYPASNLVRLALTQSAIKESRAACCPTDDYPKPFNAIAISIPLAI